MLGNERLKRRRFAKQRRRVRNGCRVAGTRIEREGNGCRDLRQVATFGLINRRFLLILLLLRMCRRAVYAVTIRRAAALSCGRVIAWRQRMLALAERAFCAHRHRAERRSGQAQRQNADDQWPKC